MTLHDKVQDKRNQNRQKQLDQGQDKQIQDLKQQVDKLQSREDSSSRSKSRRRRRRSLDDDDNDGEEEDFDRSAQRSRLMIEQEFKENVQRMGPRYAEGDAIAENKLQAQIIALQQTVIDVLQDALLSGRSLTKADIHRLIVAQDHARDGSLEALRDQYHRMTISQKRPLPIKYDQRPRSPPRRQLTLPAPDQDDSFVRVRRVQTMPVRSGSRSSSPPLVYCRYAHSLQKDQRRPLSPAFLLNGSQRCPSCDVAIPVSTSDVWVFETHTPIRTQYEDNLVELRSFSTDARLVVKSHTSAGEFLCVLCYRNRDADCLCGSVDALISHLGRVHTSDEFEREEDMFLERIKT